MSGSAPSGSHLPRFAPATAAALLGVTLLLPASRAHAAAQGGAALVQDDHPPTAAAGPTGAPDYDFLVANLQASDGLLSESLPFFEKAERQLPGSAYLHLEHAKVLDRLSNGSRDAKVQADYLRQAVAQIELARKIAPRNLDVLRSVGAIYLDLAATDPLAVGTSLEALQAVYDRNPDDLQTALNLGRIYLDQQQAAKAEPILQHVVEHYPQVSAAHTMLVDALLRQDKNRDAEAALAQMVDFDPDAIEARLKLADLQNRRGDYKAELATLSQAPKDELIDTRLRRQLAWSYYMNGDIDHSLTTLEPLLAHGAAGTPLDPSADMQTLLLKGLALAARGDNEEAAAALEQVNASRPTDLGLASVTSKVLLRAGHADRAAHLLTELVAGLAKSGKAGDERRARLVLAQFYIDAKDWDRVGETTRPLLRAADTDPAVRQSATMLAVDALVQQKNYDAAQKLLEQAPAGHPSATVLSKRAEVLYRAGRDRDAAALLDPLASSADPLDALTAAETYQRLNRYPESVPPLQQVLARTAELQPASIKAARFLLGAAYERSGSRDKAVAEFRQLLASDPDYHAALNYLGFMFAERGENLTEARAMIEKAVALEPDNGGYVDSLGWVYYRLGRLEDARATLERAARLDIDDSTVQEHLGEVYTALGQPARASEAYRHAIALAGTDDPAKARELQQKLDSVASTGPHRP